MVYYQGDLGKKKDFPDHFYRILIFAPYNLFFEVVENELCQHLNFNGVLLGCFYCFHLYFMCIKFELRHCNTQ